MPSDAVNTSSNYFRTNKSRQKILLDDVMCVDNESNLLDCESRELGLHNCGRGEAAGVICQGIFGV